MLLGESFGEGGEHLLLGPAASFPAKPFQGRDSRQKHMACAQFLDQGFHQHNPLIGAECDWHQPARQVTVGLHRKGMKVKNTLDFGEVLTPRRIARGVVCQHIWSLPDLLGKIGEDGRRHLFLRVQGRPGNLR